MEVNPLSEDDHYTLSIPVTLTPPRVRHKQTLEFVGVIESQLVVQLTPYDFILQIEEVFNNGCDDRVSRVTEYA